MSYNTVRLIHGVETITSHANWVVFQSGDALYGVDTDPEELKRWTCKEYNCPFEQLVVKAKKYMRENKCRCSYEKMDEKRWEIEEYGLEYFESDEDGEFVAGSDFDLAPKYSNKAVGKKYKIKKRIGWVKMK